MFAEAVYFIFTFINVFVFTHVYAPFIFESISHQITTYKAMKGCIKNTQLTILFMLFMYKMKICGFFSRKINSYKQWVNETCTHLGGGRYLLRHEINGEDVMIIVKRREDQVSDVLDEDYTESYTDEVKPFFIFEQDEFTPDVLCLEKPLVVHTESGDIINCIPLVREDEPVKECFTDHESSDDEKVSDESDDEKSDDDSSSEDEPSQDEIDLD